MSGLQPQPRSRGRDWERRFETAGGGGGACGALSGKKRQSLRRSLCRGRPVGQGRHLGQARPVRPSRSRAILLSLAEKGPRFESGRAAGRPLPRPRRRGGGMRGQCAICHRRVAPRPGAPPRALIYAECALEDLDVDFVFLCQSQVKRNSWPEFLAPIIN